MAPLYLVTGAAGFIGSNIVEALLEKGAAVRGLDDFSTGHRRNLEPFLDDIDLIEGSITDGAVCARAVKGVDYVLHQAAIPSVPRSIADPTRTHAANVTGLVNMLTAAKDARVARFVFASSSSVYGDTPALPKSEDMPLNPKSPYAAQKAAGELYARSFFSSFGLPTVCLRYFNVFGKRQDPGSPYSAVLPIFITRILRGETVTIHGDGEQTRDFCHVGNVVAANLLAAECPDAALGKVFNIACGERTSLNRIVAMLREKVRADFAVEYAASRAGDVRHSLADISAARDGFGYVPQVYFGAGFEQSVEYYMNAHGTVRAREDT